MSEDRGLRSLISMLLLFGGAAILLIAVVLAVLTSEGWPVLTTVALASLATGVFLLARAIGQPS